MWIDNVNVQLNEGSTLVGIIPKYKVQSTDYVVLLLVNVTRTTYVILRSSTVIHVQYFKV